MKISYGDLTIIAENLGSLYEDGIAIGDGLELLEELPLSKNYKNSIAYIRNDILLGKSLSEAFSKFDELYPGLFIGILKVGENSGQLGRTFNKLQMFYSKLGNIKKEVKNALIYPSFLIGTLILLGVFLAFVLIPSFYESYKNAGSEAPKVAEFLYNLKLSFKDNPILFIVSVLCYLPIIPLMIFQISKHFKGRFQFIRKIKIVKELEEFIFMLILSLILDSGVSLPIGFSYCSDSNDIKFLSDILKVINEEILKGKELSECLSNLSFLSKYSISMIKLGENSGSLTVRVKKAEERLEKKTKESISKLLSLIQPTLIITMALGVVMFIWIFVLPMFDMIYGGVM
ncbi:MAG: type II secretion system F family protein [Clostridium sp.]|uniref:type II secretion system F family protein n=1 Tax=Clostridium sp. TaxID=1506 RepID=UPI0025B84490|nr:type II secretion system F family protein [Clostridium sp.]MBS5927507.1 type II secretion system F family protein [Clostridium sp.]